MRTEMWRMLELAALREVDPAWLQGMPRELVLAARRDHAGRRMLAALLEPHFALIAWPPAAWGDDRPVRDRPWLIRPIEELRTVFVRAGGLLAAEWIRGHVERSRVLAIHQALGGGAYRRILGSEVDWYLDAVEEQRLDAAIGAGSEALVDVLEILGREELVRYATTIHEVIGDRLVLAMPPEQTSELGVLRVPVEAIDAVLAPEAGDPVTGPTPTEAG